VEGDDDGHAVQGGEGVVRAVQQVGADAADEGGQAGLLPGHAGAAVRQQPGHGEEVGPRRLGAEVGGVALLDGQGQVDARVNELGDEVVDVAADPSQVGGDGGGIEKDLHGAKGTGRAAGWSSRGGAAAPAP